MITIVLYRKLTYELLSILCIESYYIITRISGNRQYNKSDFTINCVIVVLSG